MYFLEALIDTVWHKKPPLKEVKRLLRDKSANWDDIGSELDVPLNTREELRRDSTLSASGRLERVLSYWLQTEKCCTWEAFRKRLVDLDYNDVVQKVDTFLINNPSSD